MKNILVFGLILFACTIISCACRQNVTHKSELDRWRECIEKSDGSDAECEACDVLYNPEGLDVDWSELNN